MFASRGMVRGVGVACEGGVLSDVKVWDALEASSALPCVSRESPSADGRVWWEEWMECFGARGPLT